MKILNCRITPLRLITHLSISLGFTVVWGYLLGLFLLEREFTFGWIILELMITLTWLLSGLYPLYASYIHYKHDSKVKMQIILLDKEKIQIIYQYKEEPIKTIDIQDIIKIERFYLGRVEPEFYVLFLKNGEELIISSLLSNTNLLLCKCKTKSYHTINPIPDEW
ncbi:MAG: hypothetical protein M0P32_08250 [Bacteroidales bacterium]|nr:hypothetical protein [Bacteroidales bacterium]